MTKLVKLFNVSSIIFVLTSVVACSSTKNMKEGQAGDHLAQAPTDNAYQEKQDFIWQRLVNRRTP